MLPNSLFYILLSVVCCYRIYQILNLHYKVKNNSNIYRLRSNNITVSKIVVTLVFLLLFIYLVQIVSSPIAHFFNKVTIPRIILFSLVLLINKFIKYFSGITFYRNDFINGLKIYNYTKINKYTIDESNHGSNILLSIWICRKISVIEVLMTKKELEIIKPLLPQLNHSKEMHLHIYKK